MADTVRIQVLLSPELAERFERYCAEHGHKKSTLAARLLREFLDQEGYPDQGTLFPASSVNEKKGA